MSSSRVQIRVPASTSNLGPGFDCLGLALRLYNTTTITRTEGTSFPEGMIGETARAFFARAADEKIEPFGFEARVEGDIPTSRGLGSSVTVRLGMLMGLAELVKDSTPVLRDRLLNLLIELEGHPDNAVPSFLGGFAVSAHASENPADGFSYTRVAVKPELSFVTLIPDLKLSTETARGLCPRRYRFVMRSKTPSAPPGSPPLFVPAITAHSAECLSIIFTSLFARCLFRASQRSSGRHKMRVPWEVFSAALVPRSWR